MKKNSRRTSRFPQYRLPLIGYWVGQVYWVLFFVLMFSVEEAHTQNEHTNATGFVWRQCNEQVIMTSADAGPIRKLVDKRFKLKLNDDGSAGIIIVVQDCDPYYFNNKDIGTAHEIHVWAGIEGPRDNTKIPVIGAKDTLVTMSWYFLFSGSSNELAREMYNKEGVPSKPVKKLSIAYEPVISGEMVVDSETSLNWNATPKAPWASSIGVNHDIFSTDNEGKIYYTQVQALLVVHAWGSPGKMEVKGNLGGNNAIPAGSYNIGVNSFDPIWVRISLNVPLPDNASEVIELDEE